MIRRLILAALAAVMVASVGSGHPGGLDARGGHYDRQTGQYHYHRAGPAAQDRRPAAAPARAEAARPVRTEPLRPASAPAPAPECGRLEVYFSPDGGCTDAIVRALDAARKSVRIQAYSFTSAPIAQALIRAHKRGVTVTAVLDKSNRSSRYSAATFLANQGGDVLIDDAHAIAHSKIILVDDDIVITGSFNFSRAAEESNAENLLILRGFSDIFARYERNFRAHLEHAEPYTRPADQGREEE